MGHHAYVLRQLGREEEAVKAETRPKKRCDTPASIETMNQGVFEKRIVHLKGKNAIAFVLLDPMWSMPDFEDVPHRQEADMASIRDKLENLKKLGVDEVIAWKFRQPPGLGALLLFKDGCVLEEYGGLAKLPELVAINDAFTLVSELGVEHPSVRESIRGLLKHSPYRIDPDDKKIDLVLDKIRPFISGKMRR